MSQSSPPLQHSRCGWRHRLAGLLAGTAAAWLMACLAHAQSPSYEEGTHYERLPVPVETQGQDGVEVVEVFSYACYYCYSFQPLVEQWLDGLAEDVDFRRVPAVFSEPWRQLARLFYAAQSIGVLEAVHQPIFDAIHRRGRDLTNMAEAAALFEEAAGVDEGTFQDCVELVHRGNPGAAVSGGRQSLPNHRYADLDRQRQVPHRQPYGEWPSRHVEGGRLSD